jgi:hypothetical protein
MFVPYIIRRSRNNQHYALICTTALFYILAATCFGSSLPSSGSFLDPSELLEIQNKWVEYYIMCGYVVGVPECRGSIWNHDTPAHRSRNLGVKRPGHGADHPPPSSSEVTKG